MKKFLILFAVTMTLLLCSCESEENHKTETHELATMTDQGEFVEIDEEDAAVSE